MLVHLLEFKTTQLALAQNSVAINFRCHVMAQWKHIMRQSNTYV